MEESWKKLAINYKDLLLCNDVTKNHQAISFIKYYLESEDSDVFAKIIIDLDIQLIMLNTLIKSEYSLSPDILTCIEHLCSYKIYFARDCAVSTAEMVHKNIFHIPTQRQCDFVLLKSLKIITKIIENLDDFNSKKELTFHLFLHTINKYVNNHNNVIVIRAITDMFSALLLHEKFQNYLKDDVLIQIEKISEAIFKKFAAIFESDKRNSVSAISKFCDSFLRMLLKIKTFQKENINLLLEKIKATSVEVLKHKCIPYMAEFDLKCDSICLEYLCFVRTILKIDLQKPIIFELCKELVNNSNFYVIAKYLDKCNNISDIEERNKTKEMCLMILCEIIVNINHQIDLPNTGDKCKKYLFKNLTTMLDTNINNWLIFLSDLRGDFEIKLAIIKFCTMYYVHSNNVKELNLKHFESVIEFLRCVPENETMIIYYLKDILLLFAVLCCTFLKETTLNELYKANSNLEKLIFVHNLEKVVAIHPSICNWLFLNPYIKNKLLFDILHLYVISIKQNPCITTWLVQCVCCYPRAGPILLQGIEEGRALTPYPARVLRLAIRYTPLAKDLGFVTRLCFNSANRIVSWSQKDVDIEKKKWKIISTIYLLDLVSYVDIPYDVNLLRLCSNALCNSLKFLGLLETLPNVFYTRSLNFVNKILKTADLHKNTNVFKTFMNSGQMLQLLLKTLSSENDELCFISSQIWKTLLDYQITNRIYCEHGLFIKKDLLIQLTCISNNIYLEQNLKILLILLTKVSKCVLNLEIEEEDMKKLYSRCLNLVTKPGDHNLAKLSLKCLESILKYSHIHNFQMQTFCQHSCNHVMILTFFEKETSRPLDNTFLSFVRTWLQYTLHDKEFVNNKLSIVVNFWKISMFNLSNMILNGTFERNEENFKIAVDILKMLLQFPELLANSTISELQKLEESVK